MSFYIGIILTLTESYNFRQSDNRNYLSKKRDFARRPSADAPNFVILHCNIIGQMWRFGKKVAPFPLAESPKPIALIGAAML